MSHTVEPDGQFAFDIEGMIHDEQVANLAPWSGAPLGFTVDYWAPAELDAAFEHWQFLHRGELGAYAASRMWHRAITVPVGMELGEHRLDMFAADLRCQWWLHAPDESGGRRDDCQCISDLTYQAICEPCGWHSITGGENASVEEWHDHALPGWRDLPVVPARIPLIDASMRFTKKAREWITDHYPLAAQEPGAPVITERRNREGMRHIPGRSPWGGYAMSHGPLGPGHDLDGEAPRRRVGRRPVAPTPASVLDPAPSAGVEAGLGIGD